MVHLLGQFGSVEIEARFGANDVPHSRLSCTPLIPVGLVPNQRLVLHKQIVR